MGGRGALSGNAGAGETFEEGLEGKDGRWRALNPRDREPPTEDPPTCAGLPDPAVVRLRCSSILLSTDGMPPDTMRFLSVEDAQVRFRPEAKLRVGNSRSVLIKSNPGMLTTFRWFARSLDSRPGLQNLCLVLIMSKGHFLCFTSGQSWTSSAAACVRAPVILWWSCECARQV